MKKLKIEPIQSVSGELDIPGSKSISNRVLLIAAMASGNCHIHNLLDSDDVSYMLDALKKLGINLSLSDDKTQCSVVGNAGLFKNNESLELYLGNAGTAMRPLVAALAFSGGEYLLCGEPRMHERPIGDLVESLSQLGVNIQYLNEYGYPPLKIKKSNLSGSDNIFIKGNISSQFLTAILMVAPMLKKRILINIKDELVSKPYIDITLKIMEDFGVKVINYNYKTFEINGNQEYKSPASYYIEGDASSASYFVAAAAISGGTLKINGIGNKSIQGDIGFLDLVEDSGAKIERFDNYVKVTSTKNIHPIDRDLNHIPDAAMTALILGLFSGKKTVIRNIYNWRVKETDRLRAMTHELRKLGAEVVEGKDFIEVSPIQEFNVAEIETYNDHRMAMCFSLIALSGSSVTIKNPSCVNKTFPNFFDILDSIAIRKVV